MKVCIAPTKTGVGQEESLNFLKAREARIYGLTEMSNPEPQRLLAKVFGVVAWLIMAVVSKRSNEVPVVIRKVTGMKIIGYKVWPLSPAVEQGTGHPGWGHDRAMTEVWVQWWGRVWCVLNTHLDAGIQNHDPKSPQYGDFLGNERWKVTSEQAIPKIEERLRVAKAHADAVVFMGDTNVLPVGDGLKNPLSPYVLLRRLGFGYTNERVTVLAWWGVYLNKREVFPPNQTRGWVSDHAAILGHLSRPERRHPKRSMKERRADIARILKE